MQHEDAYPYEKAPRHEDAIRKYVEEGQRPGHFLQAVLRDSLVDAHGRADNTNRELLGEWAVFLFNFLPQDCWGSSETVEEWCDQGGLAGME